MVDDISTESIFCTALKEYIMLKNKYTNILYTLFYEKTHVNLFGVLDFFSCFLIFFIFGIKLHIMLQSLVIDKMIIRWILGKVSRSSWHSKSFQYLTNNKEVQSQEILPWYMLMLGCSFEFFEMLLQIFPHKS